MFTANDENMLVNSIGTTLETGVVRTQYIVIVPTVRWQSEVGIQRCIDIGPIVNSCLSNRITPQQDNARPHIAKVVKTYFERLDSEMLHTPPAILSWPRAVRLLFFSIDVSCPSR